MKLTLRAVVFLCVVFAAWAPALSAHAQCGQMSYSCSGVVSFSGTQALEDYDAGLPFDRTCFGTAYYRSNPNGPLEGLVMMLAAKNNAEAGFHRVCFAWGMGRNPLKPSTTASGSVSNDKCFLVADGTSSAIAASSERGNLLCTIKVVIP